jgi:hypothetical protein
VYAGSLNSGRLYSQATAMTRFYAKPMLLIGIYSHILPLLLGLLYLAEKGILKLLEQLLLIFKFMFFASFINILVLLSLSFAEFDEKKPFALQGKFYLSKAGWIRKP